MARLRNTSSLIKIRSFGMERHDCLKACFMNILGVIHIMKGQFVMLNGLIIRIQI